MIPFLFALAGCLPNPAAPKVFILPVEPTTESDLLADVQTGKLGDFEFTWFEGGDARLDLDTESVPASETAKGETWQVLVHQKEGGWTPGTASVEILNSLPQVSAVTFSPANPESQDTVTVSVDTLDADGDAVALNWSWTVDGLAHTLDPVHLLPSDVTSTGQLWTLTILPSDDERDGDPITVELPIGNTPPEVLSVSLSPAQPNTTTDLTAVVEVEDANGDPITVHYLWRVDGEEVADGWSSELSNELSSDEFSRDQVITLTVTPNDGTVDGDPFSADPVTVGNAPPTVGEVTLSSTEAYTDTDVSCTALDIEDADGDTVTFNWEWTVDGLPTVNNEGNPSTLTSNNFTRDQSVGCTVTPFDGQDDGTPMAPDAEIVVLNSPPSISSVTLSPDPPREGDTVQASVQPSPPTGDLDGDTVTYEYEWFINGTSQGVTSHGALSSDFFNRDNTLSVEVTPNDGTDDGNPVQSTLLTVDNTPPTVDTVTWLTPTLITTDTAEVICTASDADPNDTVEYIYQWHVNAIVEQTTTTSSDSDTLPPNLFHKGHSVKVYVSATDGTDTSALVLVSHGAITVANAPPAWTSNPIISPSSPTVSDTLTWSGVADDLDGDTWSETPMWSVDGSIVASDSDTLVVADHASRGQVILLSVAIDDGVDAGPTETDSVTVANSPPNAPSLGWGLPDLTEVDDVQCLIETASVDPDAGDALTYTFTWAVDGVPYTGTTLQTVYAGDTVPESSTQVAEAWTCNVFASDGTDSSPATAISITIEQSFHGWSSTSPGLNAADYRLEGAASGDLAGYSVGGAGDMDGDGLDDVIVGARDWRNASGTAVGAAFLFLSQEMDWGTENLSSSYRILEGISDNDFTGSSVAGAGDIDADGVADLIVGAHGDDHGGPNAGAVFLMSGADLGTNQSLNLVNARWFLYGDGANSYLGIPVSGGGDIDGDGFSDVLVGAPGYSNDEGRAYLMLGSHLALAPGTNYSMATDAHFILDADASASYTGRALDFAQDIDGDGFEDVLVGAPWIEGASLSGGVYLVLSGSFVSPGSTISLSNADHFFEGDVSYDGTAGFGVSGVDDLEGDGLGDVLIGVPAETSQGRTGEVRVQFSSTLATLWSNSTHSTSVTSSNLHLNGNLVDDHLGYRVQDVGDVDGDGVGDFSVGSGTFTSTSQPSGTTLVLGGNLASSGSLSYAQWADYSFGETSSGDKAYEAAGAGDLNGDGRSDFIVGAYGYDASSRVDAGAAFVFLSP